MWYLLSSFPPWSHKDIFNFISITLFTIPTVCLSAFTIPICCLPFTDDIPNFFFIILSYASDLHKILHLPAITSGDTYCHSLDPMTEQFYTGLLYYTMWYSNIVPREEQFRMQSFQMITSVLFAGTCSSEDFPSSMATRSVSIACIKDLASSAK